MRSRVSVRNTGIVRQGVTYALAAALTLTPAASGLVIAETPATAASVGALSVASDPAGASVYIDGQFVGQTPLQLQRLGAGDHRVRVVKDGYLENGRVVSVAAGKTGTVQVRLTGREPAKATEVQAGGGGGQSGGPSTGGGGSNKKWIYIGAAGAGAVVAGVLIANRNKPPVFSGNPTASPTVGLAVATTITFSASATDPNNDTITYSWDFGDGNTATGATATHVYNASGSFTATVKADDGKGGTATASASVTIKSMTGTWVGSLSSLNTTLSLTQSGAAITGTYRDQLLTPQFGTGTISNGVVRSTSPRVTFTVTVPGFLPFVFTGDPSASADQIVGVANQSGFNNQAWTLTRQ